MTVIGVSCPDFGKIPFDKCIEDIAKDFRHWEIFSEAEHAVQNIAGEVAELGQSYGMTFTVHSSIADTDAAAVNSRMREAACMEFMSEMEAAVSFGAECITIHPGIINLSVKGIRDRSLEAAKNTMRVLDRAQAEYGLPVAIENMPNFDIMLGIQAKELQEIVAGTDLGICLDIGHANTSGQLDPMIKTFKDRIINVHIHDNHGKSDEHLTLGDGNIDFPKVLKKMSFYKGRYIIESKSLESAVKSQEVLRDLISKAF